MMRMRSYYFIGLIFVASFLTMDYFLNQKMMKLKQPSKSLQTVSSSSTVKEVHKNLSASETVLPEDLQFQLDFKNEVARIGQIEGDPDQIENRLQSLARQMVNQDKIFLKEIIESQKINSDERALAIELLSRNQTPESAEILKNYTTSKTSDAPTRAGHDDKERIFKAQAIDGLAAYQDRELALKYLDEVSNNTQDQFLKDRVRQAEATLKTDATALE
jgi:predicted DNA-binding protein